MVVPDPPGASTDAVYRLLAQQVSEELKQTIVVDHRVGASGNIGSDLVAKAIGTASA